MKSNPNCSPFKYPDEDKLLQKMRKLFPNRATAAFVTLAVNFPDSWKDSTRNYFQVEAEITIHAVERMLKSLSESDVEKAKTYK